MSDPMTLTMPCYAGREGTRLFRLPRDLEEAISHVEKHHEVWFRSYNEHKGAVRIRKNGATKRWKKDPTRVEIPVKFGLYECARLDQDALRTRILIPHSFAPNPHDVAVSDAPKGSGYDLQVVG